MTDLVHLSGSYPYKREQIDAAFDGRITDLENGKVDKVSGKGLSENDFTTTLKNKLDGIATAATANDTDANLKNRANHTGAQAISTITGLQTALDGKASSSHTHAQSDITGLVSALSDITNRLDALEAWKADMPKKSKRFTGTTDANGDVTIDLTSGGFTSAPSIGVTYIFNNNNYGTHYNVKALSSTSVQLRVMRNKETSVLLGGSIDPDEPLASTAVTLIASEF